MSEFLKYLLLIIFLLVVLGIMWVLKDGFRIGNGGRLSWLSPPLTPCVGERI